MAEARGVDMMSASDLGGIFQAQNYSDSCVDQGLSSLRFQLRSV